MAGSFRTGPEAGARQRVDRLGIEGRHRERAGELRGLPPAAAETRQLAAWSVSEKRETSALGRAASPPARSRRPWALNAATGGGRRRSSPPSRRSRRRRGAEKEKSRSRARLIAMRAWRPLGAVDVGEPGRRAAAARPPRGPAARSVAASQAARERPVGRPARSSSRGAAPRRPARPGRSLKRPLSSLIDRDAGAVELDRADTRLLAQQRQPAGADRQPNRALRNSPREKSGVSDTRKPRTSGPRTGRTPPLGDLGSAISVLPAVDRQRLELRGRQGEPRATAVAAATRRTRTRPRCAQQLGGLAHGPILEISRVRDGFGAMTAASRGRRRGEGVLVADGEERPGLEHGGNRGHRGLRPAPIR